MKLEKYKFRKIRNRIFSFLMALALTVSYMPLSAFAEEPDSNDIQSELDIQDDSSDKSGTDNTIEDVEDDSVSEDDASVSEDEITEDEIIEDTLAEDDTEMQDTISADFTAPEEDIQPVGTSSSIVVGDYKITALDGSALTESDCYLSGYENNEKVVINTEKVIRIEMADGKTSSNKPIVADHYAMNLTIYIKDITINDELKKSYTGTIGLIDAQYCDLYLYLEGTNTLIGSVDTVGGKDIYYGDGIWVGNINIPSAQYHDGTLTIDCVDGTGTIVFKNLKSGIRTPNRVILGGNFKFDNCEYSFGALAAGREYIINNIRGGRFSCGDIRYQTVGEYDFQDNYHKKGWPVGNGFQVIETDDEEFPYEVEELSPLTTTYEYRYMDYIISCDGCLLTRGVDYYLKSYTSDEILVIDTCLPITIKMADGVESTDVPIMAANKKMTLNLTIKDLVIDQSERYLGLRGVIDAECSSLNLTLLGDNYIIGNGDVNTSAIWSGNAKLSKSSPDGELTIDGTGSITIKNYNYAIRHTDLTISGGKIKVINCNYTFDDWYNGKINISGGFFSDGDVIKNTVGKGVSSKFDKNIGMMVASGYRVIETNDSDFPWEVVTLPIMITSLNLDKTSENLYLGLPDGNTVSLTPVFTPANATNEGYTWTSSDESVATVDEDGLVTAVGNGTATITATATDGSNKKATCTVNVYTIADSVSIVDADGNAMGDLNLGAYSQISLGVNFDPVTTSDQSVTWTTSDANVVTVSSAGKIKGISGGTATITATANDQSGVSASVMVTVIKTGWNYNSEYGNWYYVDPDFTIHQEWLNVGRNSYYIGVDEYGHNYRYTGFNEIDGQKYYFDENGKLKKGWIYLEDGTYYANPKGGDVHAGAIMTGEVTVTGNMYFFEDTLAMGNSGYGKMLTDVMRDHRYYGEYGTRENGWVYDLDGYDYFFGNDDGTFVTGICEIDDEYYYFENNGHLMKHEGEPIRKTVNEKDYFVYSDGTLVIGRYTFDDGNIIYCSEDDSDENIGVVVTGLTEIDGEIYYFNDDESSIDYSYMLSDYLGKVDNSWYYFDDSGMALRGGWYESDAGEWYYFDSATGKALEGHSVIDGKLYFFGMGDIAQWRPALLTDDIVTIDGKEFIADREGVLRPDASSSCFLLNLGIYVGKGGNIVTGWISYNGGRYYCNPETGYAVKGLHKIGSKVYYFGTDGKLVTTGSVTVAADGSIKAGATAPDDVTYTIRADGSLVTGWKRSGGNWKYYPEPVSAVACCNTVDEGSNVADNVLSTTIAMVNEVKFENTFEGNQSGVLVNENDEISAIITADVSTLAAYQLEESSSVKASRIFDSTDELSYSELVLSENINELSGIGDTATVSSISRGGKTSAIYLMMTGMAAMLLIAVGFSKKRNEH